MNSKIANRIKSGVLALLLILGVALGAQAQNRAPISVDLINARGESLGFNGNDLLRIALDSAWNQMIPEQQKDIEAQTDQGVKDAIGRGTRDPRCRLNSRGTVQIQSVGPTSFNLKYFVNGNSVDFYVTTPNGVPRELDPHFSAGFDLTLDVTIALVGTRLQATQAKVYVSNAKIDSQNFLGDLVKDLNTLIRFFGGTGFFAPAERGINEHTKDITDKMNRGLDGLNNALAGYVRQGYSALKALLDNAASSIHTQSVGGQTASGQTLHIQVSRPGYTGPNLSGNATITGTIRWDKSYGSPRLTTRPMKPIATPCDLLTVQPRVRMDAGDYTPYAPGTFLPQVGWTPVGHLSAMEFADNGSQYECRYTVTSLPHDVAMHVFVEAPAAVKWGNVASNAIIGFGPTGWTGDITLRPRPKLDLKNTRTSANQSGSVQSPIIDHSRINGAVTSPSKTTQPASAATQASGNWMGQALQKARQASQPAQAPPVHAPAPQPPTPMEKAKQVADEMARRVANLAPAFVTGRDFQMFISMPPH
jgi:hypothetical protein